MTRVLRLAGIVQVGSLYGLLFLLPFSKAAVEIGFGFLLISWLIAHCDARWRRGMVWRRPSWRPMGLAVGAYLVACALSILVSDAPALSVNAFINKWLEYLLLFVIAADLAARRRLGRPIVAVLACSTAFVVIEAVTQERFGRGLFRHFPLGRFERMTGPYENPIDLATYFMVVIPIFLAAASTARSRWRWVLWVGLMGLMACVTRTEAMSAWLGLGVGLLIASGFDRGLRRAAMVLLVATAVGGGAILHASGHFERAVSFSDIGRIDREYMWKAAIGMIRDRPVLGHGLNTFMANYLRYRVGGEAQPRYAHNCYLQVAAETGLVGLVTFLALLALLCVRLITSLRRLKGAERTRLAGWLAGLLAFLVQAGLDTNFYALRQAALFWTLAGVALGCSMQGDSEAADVSSAVPG